MEDFTNIPSQFDDIVADRPVVFVSYSWDSDEHKQWVKKLADTLRVRFGINVLLDQYNRGRYNLVDFMMEGIRRADRVLIISTPKYKEKVEKQQGGTAFEDQLVSIELYKEFGNAKYIPVLREGSFDSAFNQLVEVRNGFDMRDDSIFDSQLELLASDIWNNPLNAAPALGPKPDFSNKGGKQIATPAAKTMTVADFVVEVKRLLSDSHGLIALTDLIETEGRLANDAILSKANYNFNLTEALFDEYIKFHLAAVEKLIAAAIIIVRFGTLEQQRLFTRILVQLSMKTMRDGEVVQGNNAYLHLWASQFLFHSIGVSCVMFEQYRYLPLMMTTKVPAGNVLSYSISVSLPFLAGCCHWDNGTLNYYMRRNWIYPYSWLLIKTLRPYFTDYVIAENEFENFFLLWEHLFSLMYEYYNCGIGNYEAFKFPLGQFVSKRASLYQKEVDSYTEFFNAAEMEQDEWKPLKDGLFGGKYQYYKSVYGKAEVFYRQYGRTG